jgi:FHS family L-fucose permease-like MFS transporter
VYVLGAFIAGFSMCMLNLVVNPMLNTLGGGGNKGNQLVQFGCSLNSVGATLSPAVLGWLIGEITKDTAFIKAAPALMIAMGIFALAFVIVAFSKIPEPHMETAEEKAARLSGQTSLMKDIATTLKFRHFTLGALAIFFYIVIEVGVPSMGMLYMTDCVKDAAGEITSKGPGYVGGAVAGVVCGAYWFLMMCGRLLGGVVGGKISSRVQVSFLASLGIALLVAVMFSPVKMITLFGYQFPLSMAFMVAVGLCTSVMWGGIFNMAAEGLGKYVPMGSGIFMCMVFGGILIPVQGLLADKIGILSSYWLSIGLLAYVLFYALVGSRVAKN